MKNKKHYSWFLPLILILFIPFILNVILINSKDTYQKITIKGEKDLIITADLYETGSKSAPVILLFHQAHSSRGEYRQIAPELVKMGFNCLAVDTRAGDSDRWNNVNNETTKRVEELKLTNNYYAAYSDLEAALKWIMENGYKGKKIIWGSSFSSSLVFRLAGDYKNEISGLLSFSPGEYFSDKETIVAGWAGKVDNTPCYVTCGSEEQETSKPIFDAVKSTDKKFVLPEKGRHGSSILMDDKNNWKEVKIFLKRFLDKK
jgi:dienelactone hydrolase